MDVQPGHCWRCEKRVPQRRVPCRSCPVAMYCSTPCRDQDIRHSVVECEMFGEQRCSACGKRGKTFACSACNNAWYCNAACQRNAFPVHKKSCRDIVMSIKQLSPNLNRLKIRSYGDYPEYFGNTIAVDFLQLENNEWSGQSTEEKRLDRDYHVLSAGCGDLRNTVLTAASLPAEYQGKLHVTLNDLDPFMMARNVLFLFMLVRFSDTDYIASSLTTIWYSLHLPKRDYELIKTSLDELIQMSARELKDATNGMVSVLGKELEHLRQVWKGWQSLECRRDNPAAINLTEQRNKIFENSDQVVKDDRSEYLKCLDTNDRTQIEEWFEHGLILPTKAKQKDVPFNNPTLTAMEASRGTAVLGSPQFQPSLLLSDDGLFVYKYLMSPRRTPFRAWDCLRVKEHAGGSRSTWMVMYHSYVTNLLQKFKSFVGEGRLLIRVSLTNCLLFPEHHQSLHMPAYDRVFTSNLADYIGFAKLLQVFKPLLNFSNSFSVVVIETMGLYNNVLEAIAWALPKPQVETLVCDCMRDLRTREVKRDKVCDYYNNTSQFLLYL